ncbi:hypothetical protein JKP88DRAFT_300394 [Tribonema minus]|uniref:Pentacotripeptide-repeat region of PRORP domain-containing protein n=1 Tax=Tribonema minus TaxID=303371 RepID=A0A835Z8W0_9STRA|nr:hypothetical protein JKP88DRAFT_300394 [Tribonema minus]
MSPKQMGLLATCSGMALLTAQAFGEDDRLGRFFSRLVTAARNRDRRLLVATLKKLERDEEFLEGQRGGTREAHRLQDALLKACSRCGLVDYADRLFEDMLARARTPTVATAAALLEARRERGDVAACVSLAQRLLAAGVSPGRVSLNIVVGALAEAGRYDEAMEMVAAAAGDAWQCAADVIRYDEEMEMVAAAAAAAGDAWWCATDVISSYNTVIGAAARKGLVEVADRTLQAMLAAAVAPDAITANSLIHARAQARDLKAAQHLFEQVLAGEFYGVDPTRNTFNIGIAAYIKGGDVERGLDLLEELKSRNLEVQADTYNTVLSALCKGCGSRNLEVQADTYNTVLSALCKARQPATAIALFEENVGAGPGLVAPNRVTYNIMLEALRSEGRADEARRLYRAMRDAGVAPDCHTLSALVRVQEDAAGVYRALQSIHRHCLAPNTILMNNAIRALGEHGDAAGACRVFDQMARARLRQDRVSYNSLLHALAQRGQAPRPGTAAPHDRVSYNSLLHALAQRGPAPVWRESVSSKPYKRSALPVAGLDLWPATSNITAPAGPMETRLRPLTGTQATMAVLRLMRDGDGSGSSAPPIGVDAITYTTVLAGVVRAATPLGGARGGQGDAVLGDARGEGEGDAQQGGGWGEGQSAEAWSQRRDACLALLEEAVGAGVAVNGQMCNAVLQGYGADVEGSIELWRTRLRPLLLRGSGGSSSGGSSSGSSGSSSSGSTEDTSSSAQTSSSSAPVLVNLFRGYTGLLYVCGRALRPDAAVKVVYAMAKDGLTLSPEVASAYFNARRATTGEDYASDDAGKGGARSAAETAAAAAAAAAAPATVLGGGGAMGRYLRCQFEELLVIECGGASKKTPPSWTDDLPIKTIRIKW